MRTIFTDAEHRCHVAPADGRTAIETDFFDGKCDAYIEGYRLIPDGETWTREDGVVFPGGMVAPFADYQTLDAAQREFERQQLEQLENDLAAIEEALLP